jgi:D-alanyl-D-alanine carboxypeptidase
MTRALLTLLLVFAQLPLVAAPRRRAVQQPQPVVASAAVVAAARQSAAAALQAGVPAVQIAVSERGQIIYAEAFGVTDTQSATAATARSVFQVGSVTKQFTAAAVLRLAERGALTLDDRIEKYVPEFDPRGRTITLRQLLSHTSGLPRTWWAPNTPVNGTLPVTRQQTIAALNSQPFLFATGTQWSYSNAGYTLLGYAIESITGMSYADFIHTELALPLGLFDTGVCGTSGLPIPEGYGQLNTNTGPTWVRMPALHMSVPGAAGSLCSTATDLARWSHLLARGHALLPASYATMTTPAKFLNDTAVPNGYALGLVTQSSLGQPVAWHDGAIDGFETILIYLSNQDIAVAVITNGFPSPLAANPYFIGMAVAKAALGAP